MEYLYFQIILVNIIYFSDTDALIANVSSTVINTPQHIKKLTKPTSNTELKSTKKRPSALPPALKPLTATGIGEIFQNKKCIDHFSLSVSLSKSSPLIALNANLWTFLSLFYKHRCTRTNYYEVKSKKKSKHTTKSTKSSSFQIC